MRGCIKCLYFLAAMLSVALSCPVLAGGNGPEQYMIDPAGKGDAWEQLHLGEWYESRHNYSEAAKWYGKAAGQGNAAAQFHLGLLYEHGQGVPKDYSEAVEWFRKSV